MFFFLALIIVILNQITGVIFNPPIAIPEGRWNNLYHFYKLRTKYPQERCFWHYSGSICSLVTGKMIARIEGLEEVVPLVTQVSSKGSENCSYLSNKVFFYVSPTNQSNLLHAHKLQPISPEKVVQPIKFFKELISISPSESNQKYNTQIWFSSKRCFSTRFEIFKDSKKPSNQVVGVQPTLYLTQEVRARQNHRFRRWISFSSTGGDVPRCYETYSFYEDHTINFMNTLKSLFGIPTIKLIYKRQGLGPSWYIPGAMTRTELIGVRYNDYKTLPTSIKSLLSMYTNSDFSQVFGHDTFVQSADNYSHYRPWYVKLLEFVRS